jgi:uncharacterized membrane protein SpoIIM required for sporulation/uncharacterized RDD family membrane protein YckC
VKDLIIKIETPERIRFKYRIAQPGARAAALMIDLLIQFGVILLWFIIFMIIWGSQSFSDILETDRLQNLFMFFSFLLIFFLQWGYFSFFEIVMNGQTPGKKALKIFVISRNGRDLKASDIILRNLLRVVDGFPLVHVVGGLVAFIDKRARRLGDILANTLVVMDDRKIYPVPDFTFYLKVILRDSKEKPRIEMELKKKNAALNENQLYIIRQFLQKSPSIQQKQREEMAAKLADMVFEKTAVSRGECSDEDYLALIYSAHQVFDGDRILSHDFLYRHQKDWDRLESLNQMIRKEGFKKLSEEDMDIYPRLYREACGDLAEARLKKLSPDLMAYLNQIVAAAHLNFYSSKRSVRSNIFRLFSDLRSRLLSRLLPAALKKRRWHIILSAVLFLGAYLVTGFLVYRDSGRARIVVPDDVLLMMEESYSVPMDDPRSSDASTAMFAYYVQHNVSIAFISFATGIILGLGSLYFLVYNGMLLGSISGYIIAQGYGRNFLVFVTAHSVFELSGLIIAGAAGLLLGSALVAPGNISRKNALNGIKTDLLVLVGTAAVLISCAAVLEGFVSPQPIPYAIKAVIAGLCLSLETGYLIYCGIVNRRRRHD